MPFDPTGYNPAPDLTELQPGREGLRQLSYLLRHPEEWPEGHVWDFRTVYRQVLEPQERPQCGTVGCAMGLADVKWGESARHSMIEDQIPYPHYNDLFFRCRVYGVDMEFVLPTMVADAIDFYLREGRVPVDGEASHVA